jgi:hypothetical protein
LVQKARNIYRKPFRYVLSSKSVGYRATNLVCMDVLFPLSLIVFSEPKL